MLVPLQARARTLAGLDKSLILKIGSNQLVITIRGVARWKLYHKFPNETQSTEYTKAKSCTIFACSFIPSSLHIGFVAIDLVT
jgi:hypothetical protein